MINNNNIMSYNNIYRYIDDLLVINNNTFINEINDIYPETLLLNKQNDNDNQVSYLDLDIKLDEGRFILNIYDKRDNFKFPINNFPYTSSNINENYMLNVYMSQLVRYARICSNIEDFHSKHKYLTNKLIGNGFTMDNIRRKFKLFAMRHGYLLQKWNYNSSQNGYYIKKGILFHN
jgi:hypothetical protein